MSDRFYDYSSFDDSRVRSIFTGWDGFGGYHGLLLKKVASLIDTSNPTVLDVGCGLCHLYELIKGNVKEYVGVDNHPLVLEMARARYPNLRILNFNVYDLNLNERFDYIYAIGLYSDKPNNRKGIDNMLRHTKHKLIMTYWKDKDGVKLFDYPVEEVKQDIDSRLAIVVIKGNED